MPAISVRNGPVEEEFMDIDPPVNGGAKRKSRGSLPKISYKDESESEGEPLVRFSRTPGYHDDHTDTKLPSVQATETHQTR